MGLLHNSGPLGPGGQGDQLPGAASVEPTKQDLVVAHVLVEHIFGDLS